MTKLFKNSKQVLAFVFAFVVLAVSLSTGSINITADACDTSKVVYWDGTKATGFASGTGTEADPFIIKTAEQLAFACLGQTPDTSTGKYYKVDDSVKIFVLQPETVVTDLNALLALDSAEATKNYFAGLNNVKNWHLQFNQKSFNGHFDGNGATIYGLYVDTVNTTLSSKDDCGLFPQFDGGSKNPDGSINPTVCKNLTVKNSYYLSNRRMGGITGAAYGTNYGAKIDGKVKVDNCAVINCYMEGNAQSLAHYTEEGIVVGGGNLDVVELSNILVKGTYAYDTVQNKAISIIGSTSDIKIPDPADSTKAIYQTKVTNSIFLGVAPYQKDYYIDQLCQEYIFSNVITDAAAGKVTINNPAGWGTPTSTRDYAEDQIKQVTASGFEFQASATALDWENTWFMSENGPELRAFHGEIKLDATKTTHVWECEDCGLQSSGGVAEHRFALTEEKANNFDTYTCKDCGYECKHTDQSDTKYEPGDCLTAPGTYSRCKNCPSFIATGLGDIPGHELTYVEADPGHCEQESVKAYWLCAKCENKFSAVDAEGNEVTKDSLKLAPFDSAVSDDDLKTGEYGDHIKKEDENGAVVIRTEDGHQFICKIHGGKITSNNKELAEDKYEKHSFKNAQCEDCGYTCENHEFKATGKVIPGSCTKDEEIEYKCSKCGWKKTEVSKKAGHSIKYNEKIDPTDKMEGTKAHYMCDVCKEIYADAEGKTKITKASLIIPREIPEGDNSVNVSTGTEDNYMENPDTSTTSPVTGENVAPVILAITVLAGAAFVVIRKVVKA